MVEKNRGKEEEREGEEKSVRGKKNME